MESDEEDLFPSSHTPLLGLPELAEERVENLYYKIRQQAEAQPKVPIENGKIHPQTRGHVTLPLRPTGPLNVDRKQ